VLVEFDGVARAKGKTNAKVYTYSQAEKEKFYAQLKGYALTKGYKDGWAFFKYKKKFDVEPSWNMRRVVAMAPGPEVIQWIRSEQIAWALSKKNPGRIPNANQDGA